MEATFDLERYLCVSGRLDVDDLDWNAVPDYPLTANEIRALQYFIDIETYTIIYLKELLATPAQFDGQITAFMGCWNYEEFFHGHTLERFLNEYGVPATKENKRTKAGENLWNKFWLLGQAMFSKALDWRFICVYMTWGALNELCTLSAYQQIIEKTRHPILREICRRIVKDERRHFSFYYNQAKRRLEDPLSRKITRLVMDRLWAVVGAGQKPPEEVDFLANHLFGGDEGQRRASEMDGVMAALPGFEGVTIVQRAMQKHLGIAPTMGIPVRTT